MPEERPSKGLQKLHQGLFLIGAQAELLQLLIVLHHIIERGKATIVVKASLGVREQSAQGCRAVLLLAGTPFRLEVVHANLRRRVQVPSRLSEKWRNVACRTLSLAFEELATAVGGACIETAGGW